MSIFHSLFGIKFLVPYTIIILLICPILSHKTYSQQTIVYSLPLPHLKITSYYGMRKHPITKEKQFHQGIDLACNADTLRSMISGIVIKTGYSKSLGNYLQTKHGQICIVYGHLSCIFVYKNQIVNAGEPLAITGSTGKVTAEHLHLQISLKGKSINPLDFFSVLANQAINIKN